MDIADNLLCLFTAEVEELGGGYVIRIPDRELQMGDVRPGDTYRIAIIGDSTDRTSGRRAQPRATARVRSPPPPVNEGDQRTVEIEDIGDQGDGVARVERGYVLIVPDTEVGERVTVEVTDVKENVAFAEVVERHHAV